MTQRPVAVPLPQLPTDERVEVDSVEWLFEPDWGGRRIMARVEDGTVRLTDAAGDPIDDEPDAAALLGRAVRAASATLDGVWTEQAFTDDEGSLAERHAFVAIDLVELDGERLDDVPFQERRRLLASVLEEGLQVRVSSLVKQPLGGWLAGWRQAGFTHYLARHQNAGYHPGVRTDDWLRIPLEAAPAPGLLRRVVGGGRGGRPRRIRD
jgi:bifunctional non-homologous end joining protein LigD